MVHRTRLMLLRSSTWPPVRARIPRRGDAREASLPAASPQDSFSSVDRRLRLGLPAARAEITAWGARAERAVAGIVTKQKTAPLPAPFLVHPPGGTGPLRLALAGATRSGSAGVGSLARDPLARLRRVRVESIGTAINFRPAAITNRDIAALHFEPRLDRPISTRRR